MFILGYKADVQPASVIIKFSLVRWQTLNQPLTVISDHPRLFKKLLYLSYLVQDYIGLRT